ncbi:AAA family ATPase [Myroides marinus]|uniref:McrB family protein n=1 Tax=Myroides marinus TaxID=703342 RepID=UPI0025790767|nr:AAA family ATPase [Myroides marinus]MDM1368326.1 AAA family ATPase [Myroides marinus]MDM1390310.1 AAA family ATPase [Myroides marinus]
MDYFDFGKTALEHYCSKAGKKYDSTDSAAFWYYDVRTKLYYLVELVSKKVNKDFNVVYRESPNGQAGRGSIVFKPYILAGFSDNNSIGDNLFLKFEISGFDNDIPRFAINIDINFRAGVSPFKERRKEIFEKDYHYWPIDDKFPKSWDGLIDLIYPRLEEVYRSYCHYIKNLVLSERIHNELKMKRKLLEYKKQVILQGSPGTGKTREAKLIAKEMIGVSDVEDLTNHEQFKIVQFHPSYTYEDFVRGIATVPNGNSIEYQVVDRGIAEFAQRAYEDSKNNYIIIIDEINRANLSSVLGELIYALEYRGKGIEGMYSKTESDKIILPPNLYIIGTMNTADRSVGHIDYAIRRRFAFVDVLPKDLSGDSSVTFDSELFNAVKALFTTDEYVTRSPFLSSEFDPKDVALGHSYFIQQYEKDAEGNDDKSKPYDFSLRLEYEIKPILREYIKDGILIGKGIEQKVEELETKRQS